jgi:acyl CoA:acetate/3-ketoacid CoA transferase beta subunit
VTPDGLILREVTRGLDPDAVQAKTEVRLRVANDCCEMEVPDSVNGMSLLA